MKLSAAWPLAVMGVCATADRARLAMHGHDAWVWTVVYALGYALLVWLTSREQRASDKAVYSGIGLIKEQFKLIALQQERIRQLESSNPGGTIPPGPSSA